MNQTPNGSGVQRGMQHLYKVAMIARAEAAKAQIQNHRGDLELAPSCWTEWRLG